MTQRSIYQNLDPTLNGYHPDWYDKNAKLISRKPGCSVISYQCNGTGILYDYSIFPGIDLIFMDFNCSDIFDEPNEMRNVLEIRHYQEGRVEFEFEGDKVFHLQQDEFCVNGILAILSQLTSLFHLGTVTKRMRMLLTTPAMEGNEQDVHTYDIELKNVTFAYAKEDVIKDVSLKIPSGSITALVGPSGSGKSTISKLIARFWDVQKGSITIGGENIKNIEPEHLMKSISFVFQDVTLFNDTVYNNIRVGNMAATEEQVMAAAKAAYCDEFVMRLSDGYQTVLGENGSTLSGGERQRISIARALLKDAPIILLDEATASLDPENEVLIQRAIARLVEGKTVIMIAHRLRTVVDADQIFVLENGKLVERGTHDELIAHKGLYEKLYHIQQESLDWVV